MNLFKLYIVSVILLLLCAQASDGGIVLALLIKLIALKGALFLGTPIALGSFIIGQGVGFFAGKLVGGYAVLKAAQKYHEREKGKWKGSNVVYSYKGYKGHGWKGKSKGAKYAKGYKNGYGLGSVISDAVQTYKKYKVKYGSGWKSHSSHGHGYSSSGYPDHISDYYTDSGYKPGPPPSTFYDDTDSGGYKPGPPPSTLYDTGSGGGYKTGPPTSSFYDTDPGGYKPGPPPDDPYSDYGHGGYSSYSNQEPVTQEPPSLMEKIISKIPLSSYLIGSKGDEGKVGSASSLSESNEQRAKYKVPSNFPYKNTHLPGQYYKPPAPSFPALQSTNPSSIQAIINGNGPTPNFLRSPEDTDFSYFPNQNSQPQQNNNFNDFSQAQQNSNNFNDFSQTQQNKDIYKYEHPDDPGHLYGFYPGSSQIYDGPGKKYTGVLTDIYDNMKKHINPHGYGIPMGKPMGLGDDIDGPGVQLQSEDSGAFPSYEGPGKEFTGMITDIYDAIQKTKEKEFEKPLGRPMGIEDYPDENMPYEDLLNNFYSKPDKSKRKISKPNYLVEKYLENKLQVAAAQARDENQKQEAKKLIDLLRKVYINQLKASVKEIKGNHAVPKFVPFPSIPSSTTSTSTEFPPTSTTPDLIVSSTERSISVGSPNPSLFKLTINNIMSKLATAEPMHSEEQASGNTNIDNTPSNPDSDEDVDYELEYEYDSGEHSEETVKASDANVKTIGLPVEEFSSSRHKRDGESLTKPTASKEPGVNLSTDQAQQIELLYTFMEEIKQFFTLVSVLDQDTCLQKMVCDVHSKLALGQAISNLSTYESNMVTSFRIMDTVMPLNNLKSEDSSTKYRIAAKIGEATKSSDICQRYYSSCAYTTSQIISLGNQVETTSDGSSDDQPNYSDLFGSNNNPLQRQDNNSQTGMPKV